MRSAPGPYGFAAVSDTGPKPTFPFITDIPLRDGDVVFATDRRGHLVYWSIESERLFGYAAEDVLGRSFEDFCRPAVGHPAISLPAVLSGRDFAGAVRCETGDRRGAGLYLYASAGRSPSGEPTGVVFVGRDVSGVWQAQAEAQVSADKYRLLFENTVDSVAIADMEGRVLEVNPACLRLYGYTAEDVRSMNLVDVVAPESRAAAAEVMDELGRGNRVQTTLSMLRKDGTAIVVALTAYVIEVGDDRRIFSVTHDITERVQAEARLRESEKRYRTIFASVGDAVFLETLEGSIIEVNDKACELLGYTREELLALKVSDLVPPDARAWLPRVTDAVLRDKVFRSEAINVHKSGRQIPVEVSVAAMELEDRTLMLAIVRDISRRREAEKALRESEEKYRSVVERASDGICIIQAGEIKFLNRRLAAMAGYAPDELVGRRFVEYVHPEDRSAVLDRYRRRLAGEEQPSAYPMRFLARGGEAVMVEVNVAVAEYGGAPAEVVLVRDITERLRAEQALRESEDRLRRLLDNSPDGVAVHQDGSVVMMNPAGARMLGYDDPSELKGMAVVDFLHPDEKEEVLDRMRRVLASGPAGTPAKARFRCRDGSYIPLEVASAGFVWQGRAALQVCFRDVSERERMTAERRQAERALHESEERYRRLVDESPDGIAVYQDGVVVLANPACAHLLGYDGPDALVGRPAVEVVNPDDLAAVGERERALDGRPARAAEGPLRVRYRRRDGQWLHTEVVGARTVWQGRPAIQVMARRVGENITEGMKAEG